MSALTFPSLADDVILLRPWNDADVSQQLGAFGDLLFEVHSDWAPRDAREVRRRRREQEQARRRGEQIDFAVADVNDPRLLLGGASLNGVNPKERRALLGYWLTPAARGRGVATRAVRLMVLWAFVTLQLARLEITCGPDSQGSQHVAERCGFTREGLLRSHLSFKGGRRDSGMFSLLPGEFI